MRKPKVLFLCTGNADRSQMAEAFLRQLGGDRFEAYSAGLAPRQIGPYTRQVMAEVGHDLADQRSKDVSEYLGRVHFGYLITVCSHAEKNCPTAFLGIAQRLHWAIVDPAEYEGGEQETLARFREARDEVRRHIQTWLDQQA